VLNKNGKLFCRLTSNQEYNYHFVKGENIGDQITQIEEDYFLIKDTYKRFFTEDSIKHFFQDMDLISLKNYDIGRHQQKKNLYEIIYRKL
jgi:hypothetical protein